MASSSGERGEPSSTKTDKPGIMNQLAGIMFCYRPTIRATAHYDITPSPWTSQNLRDNEVLPGADVELLSWYERQDGVVRSMAAGKDGVLYTSASDSTNIRYWKRGEPAGGFRAENRPNDALLLDRTAGGRVFVGSSDGKVRVFEVGPEVLPSFTHLYHLPWLETRRKKKIWKKKMEVMEKSKFSNWQSFPVTCMSFSEVSEDIPTYLYTGSTDHSIKVWSLRDLTLVDFLDWHEETVNAVAAGCGARMFSGSQDGSLHMWFREATRTNDISHSVTDTLLSAGPASVNALFLKSTTTGFATEAGRSELYAGLSDGRVLVWKERLKFSKSDRETLRGHNVAVTCLAGSPGHLVFSGSEDGKICAWSSENDTKLHTHMKVLNAHGGPVNCIAAQEDWERNDDGNWSCILYSGSEDKTLKTWRIETSVDDV